jgi:peptide/nickel transport system permease protein
MCSTGCWIRRSGSTDMPSGVPGTTRPAAASRVPVEPRATIGSARVGRPLPGASPPRSQASLVRRWLRGRTGVWAAALIVGMVVLALIGPAIAPYNPIATKLPDRLQPPSSHYLLGTDSLGRDVLSRMLYGTRIDFEMGLISVLIGALIGTAIGLVAGFYAGAVDNVAMGFTDILLAFPYLLLGLLVVTALGPGLTNTMIAVGIVFIPQYVRLVRSMVLSIKGKDYVLAARALGASNERIMVKHILVNSYAPIIVQASLTFGVAIVSAAGLSFLGLGAQPPTPEWGRMLTDGRDVLRQAPWVTTAPGLAILLTAIAFNVFGDSLRDALDPRLKS